MYKKKKIQNNIEAPPKNRSELTKKNHNNCIHDDQRVSIFLTTCKRELHKWIKKKRFRSILSNLASMQFYDINAMHTENDNIKIAFLS